MIIDLKKSSLNELSHFGTKGMKWGVRKDRQFGTNDITIEKGSTIYRVTEAANERYSGHTYAVATKEEAEEYTVLMKKWKVISETTHNNTYRLDMSVKKTLIGPSEKKRIDTMIETLKDKTMKEIIAESISSDFKVEPYVVKKDIDKALKGDVSRRMQRGFSFILATSKPVREEYIRRLSEQGYNMVPDDNDLLKGSKTALMVFDRRKTLNKGTTVLVDRGIKKEET
jgi:hypothetical protein